MTLAICGLWLVRLILEMFIGYLIPMNVRRRLAPYFGLLKLHFVKILRSLPNIRCLEPLVVELAAPNNLGRQSQIHSLLFI